MDKAVYRAFLGDQKAADALTAKGVLLPCPFCQSEAIVHEGEYSSKWAQHKKEIPKGARLIRCTEYPSGMKYYEYRQKMYTPRCVKSGCVGRSHKSFRTITEAIKAWNTRPGVLTPEEICELEE